MGNDTYGLFTRCTLFNGNPPNIQIVQTTDFYPAKVLVAILQAFGSGACVLTAGTR